LTPSSYSGTGTSSDPYIFNLPNIDAGTTGYINAVFTLTGTTPTSGSLVANMKATSTDQPTSPATPTCQDTKTFNGTAVTMTSFVAQPQAAGVGLSWWANVGSEYIGFKIKSKLPSDSQYKDLPGAFIPAALNPFGANYSFVDTSAQPGITDYLLVPVTNSNGEGSPLSTTINYVKIFLPAIH